MPSAASSALPSAAPATPRHLDRLVRQTAEPYHLLAVADDVSPQEVETLAAQIWPEAQWQKPGLLHLTGEAFLTGPWTLTPETITGLDLPMWARDAYLISAPALRGGPVPAPLLGTDPLVDAFPAGNPEGLELEVLQGVRRIARRLAGALRLNTGSVLVPDPDSAVNLRVLSLVWLDPAACLRVLEDVMPGAHSLLDSNPPTAAKPGRAAGAGPNFESPAERMSWDRRGLRQAATSGLSEAERAWLHAEAEAFDEAALAAPQVLDAYAIGAPCGASSQVHVVVQGETAVPVAFGQAPDGLIAYEVRWIPRDIAMTGANKPPRSQRLERLAAIELIESCAAVLEIATQGVIIDEDGFTLALND